MHLVVTRSYPPEIGGMQNLMWGLTNSLSKHDLINDLLYSLLPPSSALFHSFYIFLCAE